MVQEISDQSFQSEVLDSDLPVLVDFWAPWCGPCRMVAPVVEKMSEKFVGQLKVVKMNTDENQAVASELMISGIPSLVIFKNGKEVDRLVGFRPPEQMEEDIRKVI